MRRVTAVTILLIALFIGALTPAQAQCITNFCPPTPPPAPAPTPTPPSPATPGAPRSVPTPLGWYAIGSIACAAVSPMVGTIVLGRELTVTEVDRMALSCFLGPVGWVLGPVLFPDPAVAPTAPPRNQ